MLLSAAPAQAEVAVKPHAKADEAKILKIVNQAQKLFHKYQKSLAGKMSGVPANITVHVHETPEDIGKATSRPARTQEGIVVARCDYPRGIVYITQRQGWEDDLLHELGRLAMQSDDEDQAEGFVAYFEKHKE